MILDVSENSWMVMSTTPQFLDSNDTLLPRGSQGNMNYWPQSEDGL